MMPNFSLSTLLFDLDGTLTNPAPGFLASVHYALDQLGVEAPSDDELKRFIGPPLRDTFAKLLGADDRDQIEQAVDLYRWRLGEGGGQFEAEVIDSIPETLQHFAAKGHPMFVCTGKPDGTAVEIVEHFGLSGFFQQIYGAKLDGRFCDKAELIAHIWEVEPIPSAAPTGVMIGDTTFDLIAGQKNHLKTVAVGWGFSENSALHELQPDQFVSDPRDLIAAIETCC